MSPQTLLTPLAFACACALTACSGDTESSTEPVVPDASTQAETGADVATDAPSTLGQVTLRFKNTGASPVYVDATFGGPLAISSESHPEAYELGTQCTEACPISCEACAQCGAPMPVVREIAAGGFFDIPWSGTYYTFQSCADSWCRCHEARLVLPGSYQAALSGALGLTGPGTPVPQDPSLLRNTQIDPSKGTCSAAGAFEMSSTPSTVEIAFTCTTP